MDPHYLDKKPPTGPVTPREIILIIAKGIAIAVAIMVPACAFAHYVGYLWCDR
jgi:hypothetical protein